MLNKLKFKVLNNLNKIELQKKILETNNNELKIKLLTDFKIEDEEVIQMIIKDNQNFLLYLLVSKNKLNIDIKKQIIDESIKRNYLIPIEKMLKNKKIEKELERYIESKMFENKDLEKIIEAIEYEKILKTKEILGNSSLYIKEYIIPSLLIIVLVYFLNIQINTKQKEKEEYCQKIENRIKKLEKQIGFLK